MKLRLDKYLADMSVGTRSQVKAMIRAKKITVNHITAADAGMKIDTKTDKVAVEGKEVTYLSYEYFMMNKPPGVITAVSDSREKTVMDLLGKTSRKDLFPVGRLDKDTTGLLLITNHGELAHALLSPARHVDKVYEVWLDGELDERMRACIEHGITLEKKIVSKPARLEIIQNTDGCSHVFLTIQEGKFHQVKRMFQAVGRKVTALKRTSFGPLHLDKNLKDGEYRPLTEKELEKLLENLK